jgi:hypothetical protein
MTNKWTKMSERQLNEVPWTPLATSSPHSTDLTPEVASQEDLEVNVSQSSNTSKRRSARATLSTQRRRAQNREAQRVFRLRAASHLKAVEDELVELKRKYGDLLQRYKELQFWGNGLLSTLLKGYSGYGYDSGITQSGAEVEQDRNTPHTSGL